MNHLQMYLGNDGGGGGYKEKSEEKGNNKSAKSAKNDNSASSNAAAATGLVLQDLHTGKLLICNSKVHYLSVNLTTKIM